MMLNEEEGINAGGKTETVPVLDFLLGLPE